MEPGDDSVVQHEGKPAREGVGAMLRARRLELGLSQADVAHMVKLPARRIEALEQERWEELPDGTFLRGFLRNIARALQLDAASLMEKVDASLVRASSPDSILIPQGVPHATLPRRNGPADERRGGRALVAGAFVFALIAALIAWSGTESFDRAVAMAKGAVEPGDRVASKAPAAPVERIVPDAPVATTSGAVAPATGAVGEAPVDPAAKLAAASPTDLPLLFHFNEESWVEVYSADGKVLLKRLAAAGSEQEVDGEAPFSLVVGNAKGVALKFRGQPVDLAPYTRDSVARFKLS